MNKLTTPGKGGLRRAALRAALPQTLPILAGYGFLGIAYGLFMRASGFGFLYPVLTALVVYGGSLEFVMAALLLSPFAPLSAFLLALMIQARHLFYGLALLDAFKGLGLKRFYLIFALSDETFSLCCTATPPAGVDRGWYLFFIALLDHIYWVLGAFFGALFGSALTVDLQGLEFVMTAMFTVILVEQWLREKSHGTALLGLGASAVCLFFFGPERFILPSMALILAALAVFQKPLARRGGYLEAEAAGEARP